MPAAKKQVRKAVKKTTKRTVNKATPKAVKRTTKRPAKRAMSAAHKSALSEGRRISAVVNAYLEAINTPKRRGRKVSTATLTQRLADARVRARTATGTDRVIAAQQVRDISAKLAAASKASGVDVKQLEAAFVKVAKKFGENRGIGYGAWRDVNVPAAVLRRAGVARTRG